MLDLGIVEPGATLNIPFATYDSNDPSASVTTTGLATTDIEIYKDGSLTQRASDTGYAVDIDFDALVGLHTIQIDLSSNATAGFFAAGSEYLVAVSSITVDAGVVSLWAARFKIGIPGMIHGSTIAVYTSTDNFTLNTGSADNDAYNGCILIAYDVATQYQTQVGVIEDYIGASKTVNLKADPGVFTMTANDNIIIMPPALTATTPGTTLDVTATGAAGVDWANVEGQGTSVDLSATSTNLVDTATAVTNGVTLAAGAITDASLAGNMEIVFETDFATNYNATRNAWATNAQDFVGTTASDPFNGQVVAASVTANVDVTNLTVAASTTLATGTHNPQTGDSFARIGATGSGLTSLASQTSVNTIDTNVDNLNLGIIYGTAQTGTLSTTQATTDLTGYADSELVGGVIVFTSGTADGQRSDITAYASASGLVTFDAITTAPANNDTFKIV